ncbi:uncharacterized protein LOC107016572 [Solanum pennellii]|uniref:Uncharacterized protein LOC107016572 n=1 Tax=Solanum pennellii TaxID=28526 RepID=A0ABM1GKU3_SOLPN|nr:uncharacterized protein LOC107016572 [Solanum pennellii]
MSVEKYSLKFIILSRYAPSLVSNPRDEMIRFVIGVADLMKEDCRTAMLHNDMNLSRLLVYSQSIEESKLSSISRNFNRNGSNDQNQSRFKKRAPNHDGPSAPKVKLEKGSGSKNGKPTCVTCGKKHYGKCLVGTGSCFGCGKDGHKVRDYPSVSTIGKDGKKDPPSASKFDVPRRNRFNSLRSKGSKPDDEDDIVWIAGDWYLEVRLGIRTLSRKVEVCPHLTRGHNYL